MKLLLPVDQSKDSKVAIKLMRQFQWPSGGKLCVLHVAPHRGENRAKTSGTSKKAPSSSVGTSLPSLHAELQRIEKLLASETLDVKSLVVQGVPGQEILRIIQKENIDLAILGSRGLSRISGLLLGSVSEWMLNDAPCSVLIGRPTARRTKNPSQLKVLLATDGSPDSWIAVEMLKSLGLPAGSLVMLLHVMKKHVYETERFVERGTRTQTEFAKLAKDVCRDRGSVGVRLLSDTRKALASLPLQIEERLALGHETHEILKAARHERADLLVVGSKGLTGLRRFLMGSVAHSVSHHAPCSVLVVRASKKKS